jgi:hypothetical protein
VGCVDRSSGELGPEDDHDAGSDKASVRAASEFDRAKELILPEDGGPTRNLNAKLG